MSLLVECDELVLGLAYDLGVVIDGGALMRFVVSRLLVTVTVLVVTIAWPVLNLLMRWLMTLLSASFLLTSV